MQKPVQMRKTIGELAQAALLVLSGMLAIVTVSFGKKPILQTDPQPVSLFKVPYGEEPTQLRTRFAGIRPMTGGGEEPLFGGGPTTFCVSWDGQLFYIADPLRCYKNLESPLEEKKEVSTNEEELVPWVQVYNRQGQWVRTIKLKYGFPSRMRVDERGWLYVDDAKRGVAVYRPDGSYDQQRTEAIVAAIRRAEVEYHLAPDSPGKTEFFEVDRDGRVYFLAHQIAAEVEGVQQLKKRLLVIHPDGSHNLLDYCIYRQCGIDRYRGEVIIGDYDVPAEGQMDVEFVVYNSPEESPDNEDERDTITLFNKRAYKCVRPNGEVARKFDWYLDISDRVPDVWDGFVSTVNLQNQIVIATDEAGHLYRIYTVRRRHWISLDDPSDSNRGMQLMDGFWIIEFSPDGRFIRSRASNLRLRGSYGHQENLVGRITNLWDVDKRGNVYWMEFHPRYVEIKMAPR